MAFFPHSENVISIRKKGNCLKMYLIEKLCVFFFLCKSLCRCFWPKHFWHSDNLQDWKRCFWKKCIVECKERPIQVLSSTICVSLKNVGALKGFVPETKLGFPHTAYQQWCCMRRFPSCLPMWTFEGEGKFLPVAEILGLRTYCLIKKAKSQLSKQDF